MVSAARAVITGRRSYLAYPLHRIMGVKGNRRSVDPRQRTLSMQSLRDRFSTRSALPAYLCICIALLLPLALSLWGAYRDARYLRTTLLQAELLRLRSHAERNVGRIERELEQRGVSSNGVALAGLPRGVWLGRHWVNSMATDQQRRVYAALTDKDNSVVQHSDPARTGEELGRHWYERVMPNMEADVVITRSRALLDGASAYDLRVPINVQGELVGDYHVGMNVAWFESWFNDKRSEFLWRRLLLVSGILFVVLLATVSLFYVATRASGLRRAVSQSRLDRASEIAQLAAGLAHEIRNPLHAIRINLHALSKVDEQGRLKLAPEDHRKVLDESIREIERVEKLMQELVNFASPDESRDELIDLKAEVQSSIDFIAQELIGNNIEIQTDFPARPVLVRFDSGRLRQLLLNLFQNSEQAMEGPGRIDVAIRIGGERVELTIADSGPGIAEEFQGRVFEPFYSTKKNGSGLGLALVDRFVTEANGTIQCESNDPTGTLFRINLPRAARKK